MGGWAAAGRPGNCRQSSVLPSAPLHRLACNPPAPHPCRRLRAENPAIAALLAQPALAGNELAMRLFYFYKVR